MATRPRLPMVQALRACAAIMVVVGHSVLEVRSLVGDPGYLRPFTHGFGVAVFFVISGFIMAYTTEEDFGSAQGRRDFIVSRLTRIVSLYWLLTTLLLVIALLAPSVLNSPRPTVPMLLNSYFFIPLRNPVGDYFPILAPGWSLNYEMFFYVLFALAMFLPRRLGLHVLVGGLVAIVVVGALFPPDNALLFFWSQPCLLMFALGILIAQYRDALVRLGVAAASVLILLGTSLYVGFHFAGPMNALGNAASSIVPAAMIVLGTVILDLRGKSLAPFSLVLLGDASYSLYLVHMFVVRAVRVVWNKLHIPAEPAIFCMLVLLISCALALVVAAKFELPLHRKLRSLIIRRRPVTAPTALEASVEA